MPRYETLSESLGQQIEQEKAAGTYPRIGFDDKQVIRRNAIPTDRSTVWRPAFVHDIDKILHCPYYNRYSDKTLCSVVPLKAPLWSSEVFTVTPPASSVISIAGKSGSISILPHHILNLRTKEAKSAL